MLDVMATAGEILLWRQNGLSPWLDNLGLWRAAAAPPLITLPSLKALGKH